MKAILNGLLLKSPCIGRSLPLLFTGLFRAVQLVLETYCVPSFRDHLFSRRIRQAVGPGRRMGAFGAPMGIERGCLICRPLPTTACPSLMVPACCAGILLSAKRAGARQFRWLAMPICAWHGGVVGVATPHRGCRPQLRVEACRENRLTCGLQKTISARPQCADCHRPRRCAVSTAVVLLGPRGTIAIARQCYWGAYSSRSVRSRYHDGMCGSHGVGPRIHEPRKQNRPCPHPVITGALRASRPARFDRKKTRSSIFVSRRFLCSWSACVFLVQHGFN